MTSPFLLIMTCEHLTKRMIPQSIAKLTFIVYLIHWLFVTATNYYYDIVDGDISNTAIAMKPLMVIVFSFSSAFLIKKLLPSFFLILNGFRK